MRAAGLALVGAVGLLAATAVTANAVPAGNSIHDARQHAGIVKAQWGYGWRGRGYLGWPGYGSPYYGYYGGYGYDPYRYGSYPYGYGNYPYDYGYYPYYGSQYSPYFKEMNR
jgi:hypothetical protein